MLNTIKSKMLALQAGLVIFAVIAIGLAGYWIIFKFHKGCIKENLEYKAATISRDLNVVIEHKKHMFDRISNSDEVINYFRKLQEPVLMECFSKYSQEFPILSYINRKGLEEVKLVEGRQESELRDFGNSDIFKQVGEKPNKTFCSYMANCPELSTSCVQFAYFNKSFFDEPIGIISGMVPVNILAESIHEFKFSPKSYAILIDTEGVVLAGGDKTRHLTKVTIEGKDAKWIKDSVKALASGFGRATISGVDSYIAHTPVEGQNWQAIAAVPHKEFINEINITRDVILLTGFIVLVFEFFVTLFLIEKILEPGGDKKGV
ncbi:MAG: hypothetical protein PHP01_04390 [Phycisphaerae bacterium]|nr:hypothetical protein [Phycisphaerae bacterium]